nr:MAG TPA: hypothetical protein [Caudoviricetes sp.]
MLLSSFPIREASSRIVIFFNSHNSLINKKLAILHLCYNFY